MEYRARVDICMKWNDTMILHAVERGCKIDILELIAPKNNVNAPNKFGDTGTWFLIAIRYRHRISVL